MVAFFQSQIVVQTIGFIALIFCIISYQSNNYRTLMSMRAVSEFIFCIHFFLLGAFSGSAIQFAGGLRNLIFIHLEKEKKKMIYAIIIFCILFTAVGIFTWDGPLSLFPITAKSVSTIAYAMSDNRKIRLIEFPTYILWLCYNIACRSIAGIINASFSLISLMIAILRLDIPYIILSSRKKGK